MNINIDWYLLLRNAAIIFGSLAISILVLYILFRTIAYIARIRPNKTLYASLGRNFKRPFKYAIPLLVLIFILPYLSLSYTMHQVLDHLFSILFIAALAWIIVSLLPVIEDVMLCKYDILCKDNLKARRIHTKIQMVRKLLTPILIFLAVGIILMRFEQFRQLGAGILASAGVVSVILGLAAHKIFGNILAGIQIAFTQPIRIDDVVIVENQWGKITEITLTYVVVEIWDQRNMILPISYFIEKPFQNWTRATADLLGTVYFYTDFNVPVDDLRAELKRIVKDSPKWDQRVCIMQVTDMTERAMEVRALVSSFDSGSLWDLRCEVREKMISFIQKNYPGTFSQVRLSMPKEDNRA